MNLLIGLGSEKATQVRLGARERLFEPKKLAQSGGRHAPGTQ
jgi:hypothetical protein